MLYVGMDWANDHHDVCLTDDSSQTLAAFRIGHDSEGFERACIASLPSISLNRTKC
jgi:transposase